MRIKIKYAVSGRKEGLRKLSENKVGMKWGWKVGKKEVIELKHLRGRRIEGGTDNGMVEWIEQTVN